MENFRTYVNQATSLHGLRIAKLRCDRGGEFSSNSFRKFCEDQGIEIEYAPTNVHQHNGLSEIHNKILMNIRRSIMFTSGVPRHWLEYAILHANFILNRSLCASIGFRTRYERWFGHQPDLSRLRNFGCIAYPYDEKNDS